MVHFGKGVRVPVQFRARERDCPLKALKERLNEATDRQFAGVKLALDDKRRISAVNRKPKSGSVSLRNGLGEKPPPIAAVGPCACSRYVTAACWTGLSNQDQPQSH